MEEQANTTQTKDLLATLDASGVKIWLREGALQIEAPRGVLDAYPKSQLKQLEADLTAEPNHSQPSSFETTGEDVQQSFARQRLWFLDRVDARSSVHTTCAALYIKGAVSVDHLEKSLNMMIARHACLRTAFTVTDDHYTHEERVHNPCTLMMVNLSELPEIIKKDEVRRICRERLATPFDLSQGLLLNAKLLRMSSTTHVLLITMPHIISGLGAMGVLVRDLAEGYRAVSESREPHYRHMVASNGKTLVFHYPVDCPAPLGRNSRNDLITLSLIQELTSPSLHPSSPVMDFDALADPGVLARPEMNAGEPAGTALEHEITDIWKDILQTGDVFMRDNFFALGGNLQTLDILLERIQELYGVSFQRRDFFDVQTAAGQARLLAGRLNPSHMAIRERSMQSTLQV